ncbi:hypothetical protein R50072_36030 [Simiduia litorea]
MTRDLTPKTEFFLRSGLSVGGFSGADSGEVQAVARIREQKGLPEYELAHLGSLQMFRLG